MIGIAEADAVARAYVRIAKELGVSAKHNEAGIRIALREADHLADDIYDVPGALLFALGRNSRCFSSFRAMSILLVEFHTKSLGFKLLATTSELATWLSKIALREVDYDEVRSWVASRLLPFGG